jgi:hypothetical protein
VGLEVFGAGELDRVGRHHRQLELGGDRHGLADVGLGARMAGALELDVEAARKTPRPVGRELFGEAGVAGGQRMAHVAVTGAGEAQQVGGGLGGQPVAADLGPAAVLVLHVGAGQQFAQLAVALAVLADQQHPVGLVPVGLGGDPAVGADDGLDALATGALVELDHPEQVGQIGDAEGRHAVGGSAGDGGIHLHDPVGDRIFGVNAQMDETGAWDSGIRGFYPPPAAPSPPGCNFSLRR